MIAPFQASHNGIRKSHGFYQEQHQIFIFRRWVSYNFSHCRFISTLCFLFRLLSAPKEIAVDMMLTKDFSIVKVLRWTLYDFRELSSLVKHFLPCYISASSATLWFSATSINQLFYPRPTLPYRYFTVIPFYFQLSQKQYARKGLCVQLLWLCHVDVQHLQTRWHYFR